MKTNILQLVNTRRKIDQSDRVSVFLVALLPLRYVICPVCWSTLGGNLSITVLPTRTRYAFILPSEPGYCPWVCNSLVSDGWLHSCDRDGNRAPGTHGIRSPLTIAPGVLFPGHQELFLQSHEEILEPETATVVTGWELKNISVLETN